ncbi:hypothetical protein Droror1_Dr00025341 [Drosera rotundifolia]
MPMSVPLANILYDANIPLTFIINVPGNILASNTINIFQAFSHQRIKPISHQHSQNSRSYLALRGKSYTQTPPAEDLQNQTSATPLSFSSPPFRPEFQHTKEKRGMINTRPNQ